MPPILRADPADRAISPGRTEGLTVWYALLAVGLTGAAYAGFRWTHQPKPAPPIPDREALYEIRDPMGYPLGYPASDLELEELINYLLHHGRRGRFDVLRDNRRWRKLRIGDGSWILEE